MFFFQVFFENNNIKFNFSMDHIKIQKNEEKFFDETRNVKNYRVKDWQDIDFGLLAKKFNYYKKIFSDKFLIDKNFNSDIEFRIFDEFYNQKDKIIKFIKQNRNLNITLYLKDYSNLINNLKDENYPNLKIKFENSENPISYKEFYDMYEKLDEIINFINHYDLSPLEKVFLVYDIVKANVYNKEGANEHYSKSRDLNQIVNGDKIVCVGYANLINYLLTNLGIKNKCVITYNKKTNVGHQKNYLYLDDTKYNIKGAFFLDVTADRKQSDDYIDNYKYFLKPFSFFDSEQSIIIKPEELTLLCKSQKEIYQCIPGEDGHNLSNLLKLLSFIDVKYSLMATLCKIYNDENKLLELIKTAKDKYNIKSIGEAKFKAALYKVRRIEYINNIIKRDLTEEYINEVYQKNYMIDERAIKLLKAIGLYEECGIDKDLTNIEEIDIDSLRMRLLKDLKMYLNDLPSNQYIKKM
ncbi:MAG: hypothetical protein E7174_03550 [Firmicutes bacterium]|nr:hypothetical protein [Bacillota bacterium]